MKLEFSSKLIRMARPPYPPVWEARVGNVVWTYTGSGDSEQDAFDALVRLAFVNRGADCNEITAGDSYLRYTE
jgi:hypothetical protein